MLRRPARPDPAHGRVAGADPGRGARPVPRRRARSGARRPPDVRRARRGARPAGDEARRVRAGRLLPAARADRPAARARSAALRPQHHRHARRRRSASRTRPPPIRNARRSPISRSICKPKSASSLRYAVKAARSDYVGARASQARRRRAALSRRTDDRRTMRWKASRPSSPRGRRNGSIAEHAEHAPTSSPARTQLFDDLSLQRGARMEGGQARPQGGRLHADLRAARAHPRRRHAAARHRRRRRPARGHPRRRLLPELHLPHSALDRRARRLRPARFRRRHAVPVDLRRDPQPVRHVEDDVPAASMSAISTCRRTTATRSAATTTSTSSPSCGTTSASCAASRSPTTSCAARSRSTTRTAGWCASSTPSGRERPWQAPAAEVYLVMRAGLVLPVEEHSAMLRDYLAAAARRGAAAPRQLPHRADRRVLRAAAAQSDQVARARRLLRGRRRSAAGHALADRRRADRGRSAAESRRSPSCTIPNRPRPNTSPTRRRRASIWSARSSAPAPKA